MIKLFRESSNAVGLSKLQTIEHLLKQINRQLPELMDDITVPSVQIQLNKVLQQTHAHQKALAEAVKFVEDQIKQNDI